MARLVAGPAGFCVLVVATLSLVWWEIDRIVFAAQRRSTRSVLPVMALVAASLAVVLVRFRVLA